LKSTSVSTMSTWHFGQLERMENSLCWRPETVQLLWTPTILPLIVAGPLGCLSAVVVGCQRGSEMAVVLLSARDDESELLYSFAVGSRHNGLALAQCGVHARHRIRSDESDDSLLVGRIGVWSGRAFPCVSQDVSVSQYSLKVSRAVCRPVWRAGFSTGIRTLP